jgi:hypothetical protein
VRDLHHGVGAGIGGILVADQQGASMKASTTTRSSVLNALQRTRRRVGCSAPMTPPTAS